MTHTHDHEPSINTPLAPEPGYERPKPWRRRFAPAPTAQPASDPYAHPDPFSADYLLDPRRIADPLSPGASTPGALTPPGTGPELE